VTSTDQSLEAIPTSERHRSGSKLLPVLLLLALAVALFTGSVFALGGVSGVMELVGMGTQAEPDARKTPVAAATPTATPDPTSSASTSLELPPGVSVDRAKRMYVEQIQSQANLKMMAEGDVSYFKVTDVNLNKGKDKAAVHVRVYFADRTSAPGVIQMFKSSGAWYVMSLTGLSSDKVLGSAESIAQGTIAQSKMTDKAVVAESGITTFDNGVINTMLAEQHANQGIATQIVGGKLTHADLGAPEQGVGTTVLPSKWTGKDATPVEGTITIVNKTVDPEDYIFLVSFKTP